MDGSFENILVIVNPVSGQRKPEDTRGVLESYLKDKGWRYELRETTGEGDALRWAQAAGEEGFDLVVVSGGDGTVVEAMTGIIKGQSKLPLAQFPAGTASLIARALGIPLAEDQAIALLSEGKCVALDVAYLPEQDRYFSLITGAGWDARVMRDSKRDIKDRLGFFAYVAMGFKALFNLRKTSIDITVDGQKESLVAHTALIINIGRIDDAKISLGPDIFHHDGKLDVMVITTASFWGIVRLAWRLLTRDIESYRGLKYYKADRVRIESSTPLPVQIDGDPMGTTPLEAEVVPDGITVLVPDSYQPLP